MNAIVSVALPSELSGNVGAPVLYTGVGKINATYSLTKHLLEHPEVDTVINYGSAGGIPMKVKRGQLVRATMFRNGGFTFPNAKEVIIDLYARNVIVATTFDSFQTTIPTQVTHIVDMESYALAHVCRELNKNFFCYKYISDIVGESEQDKTWVSNQGGGQEQFKVELKKLLDVSSNIR